MVLYMMNEEYVAGSSTTREDCINFLSFAKRTLQDDIGTYNQFLGIMKSFNHGPEHRHEISKQVNHLFKEHPKLLAGFRKFLPESSSSIDYANDSCPKRKDWADDDLKYKSSVNQEHKPNPKDLKDALDLVKRIRDRFVSNGEEYKYESFVNILAMYHQCRSTAKLSTEVNTLFHEHQDLLSELLSFFPSDLDASALHHEPSLQSYSIDNPKAEKPNPKEKFRASTEISFKIGKNDPDKLCNEKPLVGFENTISERSSKNEEEPSWFHDTLAKRCKINNKDMYMNFERNNLKRANLRARDSITETKGLNGTSHLDISVPNCRKVSLPEESREQNADKQDSEIDWMNSRRCTPSYRFLPDNYILPPASCSTEADASVLNNTMVCVTSGSEDCPFKTMQRNQYAEALFKCEDDRFGVDMMLELVEETIWKVQKLLKRINRGKIKPDTDFRIEECLASRNMRCVESLYGEHGLEVTESLQKNARSTLPVVLNRLKQKQKEWTKFRADFQPIWAAVEAKNYYKSLDHRSSVFKQQDVANLNPKALLAEVEELNEKMLEDSDMLLTSAIQNKLQIAPHFEFEYINKDIHEDIYQIIKFSLKELCTSNDQLEKVIRIWTNFLEPLFGIIPVGRTAEIREDDMQGTKLVNSHDVKDVTVAAIKRSIPSPAIDENKKVYTRKLSSFKYEKEEKEEGECSSESEYEENFANSDHVLTNTVLKGSCYSKDYEELMSVDEKRRYSNGYDAVYSIQDDRNPGRSSGDKPNSSDVEEASDSEQDDCEELSCEGDDGHNGTDVDEHDSEQSVDPVAKGKDVELDQINNSDESEAEEASLRFPGSCLFASKPLTIYTRNISVDEDGGSIVFYGGTSFYVLFRLHQVLYQRLHFAKLNSVPAEIKLRALNNTNPPNFYAKFINALYSLLDGSTDNSKFEEVCRAAIGSQSYVLFTLDKLIFRIVKQMQIITSNEIDREFLQLYEYEKSRAAEKFNNLVYHENALLIQREPIFRFQFSQDPTKLSIQRTEDTRKESELTRTSSSLEFAFLSNDLVKDATYHRFVERIKHKWASEEKAMEGLRIENGLLCRKKEKSPKVYILGTEDFLYRGRKRRKYLYSVSKSSHDGRKKPMDLASIFLT